EIGHGGMATVYRARDTRLDRLVALKVMHPHLQGTDEARQRFAREALTVARLRHPSILEIYDYSGEDSDISFIATELLTGPTLKRIMDGEFVDPLQVRPGIGNRLAAIIRKLLELDPVDRYQSAPELERDLTAFVAELGIDAPDEALAQYLADPPGFTCAFRARC